jgi:multimeric flavodoxin WrbA
MEQPIRVLVLNASLKHGPELSNTEELTGQVIESMKLHGPVEAEIVRLADMNIPVGLSYSEGPDDQWPSIVDKLKAAHVVIFATPIWWGGRSSLMQRVIERLDALDEEYLATGRSALLNKVAGVVITGGEDGAQATLGALLDVLTFMNFTIPPQCCVYWIGELGTRPNQERERRLANPDVPHLVKSTASSLMFYAKLLNEHPYQPE